MPLLTLYKSQVTVYHFLKAGGPWYKIEKHSSKWRTKILKDNSTTLRTTVQTVGRLYQMDDQGTLVQQNWKTTVQNKGPR